MMNEKFILNGTNLRVSISDVRKRYIYFDKLIFLLTFIN